MGWRDLLETGEERVTLPWLGGRTLHSFARTWRIEGRLPREHGWYDFSIQGRIASDPKSCDSQPTIKVQQVIGYLVGDHVVPDDAHVDPDPQNITRCSERVHLLEPGLDRFARVRAGRIADGCPLIYIDQEFPLGPEDAVLEAYLDEKLTVTDIKEVTPALDAAFRMESWQRQQAEIRRQELDRLRREEEARKAVEERRAQIRESLGDGAGRREMAKVDFREAARAALAVGGARYLDHREHNRPGEWAVKYRLSGQRFECICDENLHIVDSGICLTDERTGEKGDTYFTLESLPSVVQQAMDEDVLVVYRHV
jgi:hypothetical protein